MEFSAIFSVPPFVLDVFVSLTRRMSSAVMEMVWLVKSTVFSSRMLKYSPFPPPMMMWSRQGIPRIFPASITLRVVVISSCDGDNLNFSDKSITSHRFLMKPCY